MIAELTDWEKMYVKSLARPKFHRSREGHDPSGHVRRTSFGVGNVKIIGN